MANAKRKTEYPDDDEINKSLREYNEQQKKAEATDKEEPPVDKADEEDEGFGITAKKAPVVDVEADNITEDQKNAVLMTCSCCDKEWTLRGSMLNRPACSCPMYPTCTDCGHCRNHCICKAQVTATS
jgi:hypothetical protein